MAESSLRALKIQPDGDFIIPRGDGSAFTADTPLAADGVYTSSWVDHDGWRTIELFISADVKSTSQGVVIQFTDDAGAGTPTVRAQKLYSFSPVDIKAGFIEIRTPTLLDGFRLVYTNNSVAQSEFFVDATLRAEGANELYNIGGSQVVSDFDDEVSMGNISNYANNVKYGAVLDIDTADTPVDISWAPTGATPGEDTGFDAAANENLQILSTDANDQGSLVSSGTVTTASTTQLIDSAATFVTDGVAVGDMVLDDTHALHAVVTVVDSETTLTVFGYMDGSDGEFGTTVGDAYRVVNANDTGAAVVRLSGVLDDDYAEQNDVFAIMNGTTAVTMTTNCMRCSRGKVLLSGSTGTNEGDLSIRQATTTSNVFAVIGTGKGQTLKAGATVPTGKIFLVKNLHAGIVRTSGAAGSAFIAFKTRQFGEAWQSKRYEPVSTSYPYDEADPGIVLKAGTDYKFTVDGASDNDTEANATMKHITITR